MPENVVGPDTPEKIVADLDAELKTIEAETYATVCERTAKLRSAAAARFAALGFNLSVSILTRVRIARSGDASYNARVRKIGRNAEKREG